MTEGQSGPAQFWGELRRRHVVRLLVIYLVVAWHGVEREIYLLMLHGVLHCLGWDHASDDGEMNRLEERMRGQWLE